MLPILLLSILFVGLVLTSPLMWPDAWVWVCDRYGEGWLFAHAAATGITIAVFVPALLFR